MRKILYLGGLCVLGFLFHYLAAQTIQSGQLGINEVYFETSESKYYNQAIEIYNGSDSPVDLLLYQLVAGKMEETDGSLTFIGSRTNSIVDWATSTEKAVTTLREKLSNTFSNVSFSTTIPPGEIAVILDPGYRFEEDFRFNHEQRSNTLYLAIASTGVLGTGNFMKDDDVLRLLSITPDPKIVDEFHNQSSPQGYGVVKINPALKGLPDNTASRPQTIGYMEYLHDLYTTLPPNRIALDEAYGNPVIVGLPQVHNLTCKYLNTVSQLCNRSIRLMKHDYIKMYHYPSGSANLITESDAIVLEAGQSAPITLFALEPGLHLISTADHSFPDLEKTILDFNHPQAPDTFITEIYYHSNKNLTWMEVYSKNPVTLDLEVHTFNSDYRQNHTFDIPSVTLQSGYNVLGYRNQDFNDSFPLSDPVIPLPSQFAITTKGVITLSSQGKYLDIVHYDKNWYDDVIDGRSLQRVHIQNYAFAKSQWNVSTEVDSTPFQANLFTRGIDFTIKLFSNRIPKDSLKVHFIADFNVGGDLTAYLYDHQGYRIGKVFSQEVSRGYQVPLFVCLKEVKQRYGLFAGEYSLMFLFDNSEGRKTLYQKFILE